LKTFIALDDEPMALAIIKSLSRQLTDWTLLQTFTNPIEAKAYIEQNKVDLIIIDIQMPDITGVEFINSFTEEKPLFIFLTAYSDYAVRGFEMDALDYLVKPVSQDRFNQALQKASDLINLKTLANQSNANDFAEAFIYVNSEYRQVKIVLNKVLYIEAMGDYVKIYLEGEDRPILSLYRIKNLEKELEGHPIVRVHRSYLVNKLKISEKKKNEIKVGNAWIPIGASFSLED
jgi:two-component system, LytTR family, response regulator